MLTSREQELMEAAKAIESAAWGQRGTLTGYYADRIGVSPKTIELFRLKEYGRKRTRRIEEKADEDESLKEYTKKVCEYQKRHVKNGETKRALCMEDAIAFAERDGVIPSGVLKPSTANRYKRQLGITTKKRCVRMEEEHANQVHYTDGSGSEHLFVLRRTPEGRYELGVRASSEKKQKNFRQKSDGTIEERERLLVYYYMVLDGYSRVFYVEAVIAESENLIDHARCLEHAWRTKRDHPLVGLPETLFTDNGPVGRSPAGLSMWENLGIEIKTHLPGNPKAKGKVERAWRTLFQRFEAGLLQDKGRVYTLDEVNSMLTVFMQKWNAKKHPVTAVKESRIELYAASMTERQSSIRLFPGEIEDIMELSEKKTFRTVTASGCVIIDGKTYEIMNVPSSFIGERVTCRITKAGVEVRNPHNYEWVATKVFSPVVSGNYRGIKHGINEEIENRVEGMTTPGRMLYEGCEATQQGPVVNLDAAREARIHADPPAPGFRDVAEALYFVADILFQPLWKAISDDEAYQKCLVWIEENLHSRRAIEEFAIGISERLDAAVVNE